jgi:hypothetical protein
MFGRDREIMLYVESEFLLDNFKWFSRDFTFEDTIQNIFYIFLCRIVSDYFFMILLDGECCVVRAVIG